MRKFELKNEKTIAEATSVPSVAKMRNCMTLSMRTMFLFAIGLFLQISAFAGKYTISGHIKDAQNGEELLGALVVIKELPNTGASTNEYGFYSLTIPEGTYTLQVQSIGYKTQSQTITLNQNLRLDFELAESARELKEVIVTAEKADKNVTSTEMSTTKMTIQEMNKVPVLFGEKDIFKTIALTPGVKAAGDGNSGFYVRGGGIDQNLILLDEATVYNASHLLGFFSVFNSDAIKDVTVYKGGIPAQYGGRLSSVLDVKMNDGNSKGYKVSGGIGVISSRLAIEGPIVKDKGSFIISARRTYADQFLRFSSNETLKKASLYFYDLNLKANYQLSKDNKLYLSGYFGKDHFGIESQFGFQWGNATGTLRLNHIFSDKLFSNTSLIYSKYDYTINFGAGSAATNILSSIEDYNVKQDFQYYLGNYQTVKFGINAIYHTFIPGSITQGGTSTLAIMRRYALENAAYISDEITVSQRMKVVAGLRFSSFSMIGAGHFENLAQNGDTLAGQGFNLGKGQFGKTYFGPEPRVAATYVLDSTSSIKASYTRTRQYLQLLSNAVASNPTDLWVPASNNIKPQVADQIAGGYFRNFHNNQFEFSAEVYYKSLQNQIDYKDGAQLVFNQGVESELRYGKGWSYGLELFLKKRFGKFNGWIGYTISKTRRQSDYINGGQSYNARQDRPNDLSIVGIYEASKRWTISGSFVYYTGNAFTAPDARYNVDGQSVVHYSQRNTARFPDYHRLDLSATRQNSKHKHYETSWNFSIYNVYAHGNAYSISFDPSDQNINQLQATRTALFKLIPSITYNFKFF